MSKHIVVFLAEGFEEMEAVIPVDVLRRAGFTVKMISISDSLLVTGAHGITVQADKCISDVNLLGAVKNNELPSAIVLPGGLQGAKNLSGNSMIRAFIVEMYKAQKLVCAICASPIVVLSPLGILKHRAYTCYPGMEKEIEIYAGSDWKELTQDSVYSKDAVVYDNYVLTSSAAGTASKFLFEIIKILENSSVAADIAHKTLF